MQVLNIQIYNKKQVLCIFHYTEIFHCEYCWTFDEIFQTAKHYIPYINVLLFKIGWSDRC